MSSQLAAISQHIQPIANAIAGQTGGDVVIFLVGPIPERGGQIGARSISATRPGVTWGRTWVDCHPNAVTAAEQSMVAFTRTTFSMCFFTGEKFDAYPMLVANAECALRALPENQIPKPQVSADSLSGLRSFDDRDEDEESTIAERELADPTGVKFSQPITSTVSTSTPVSIPSVSLPTSNATEVTCSIPSQTTPLEAEALASSLLHITTPDFPNVAESSSTDVTAAASPPTTQPASGLSQSEGITTPSSAGSSDPTIPSIALQDERAESPVPFKRKRVVASDDETDDQMVSFGFISTSTPIIPPRTPTLPSNPAAESAVTTSRSTSPSSTLPNIQPTPASLRALSVPIVHPGVAASRLPSPLPTTAYPNIEKALRSTASPLRSLSKPVVKAVVTTSVPSHLATTAHSKSLVPGRPKPRPMLKPGVKAAHLIADRENWPPHSIAGFEWLIRDAETWGRWQSCIRMFLNFRQSAGFPVRIKHNIPALFFLLILTFLGECTTTCPSPNGRDTPP